MRSRLPTIFAALSIAIACAANVNAANPATNEIRFEEFYTGGGAQGLKFSAAMQALAGKRVRVSGYAAPPLKAEAAFFVLQRTPMHVCAYCNPDNDWPIDIAVVYSRDVLPTTDGTLPMTVVGTLEIGPKTDPATGFVSQIRLIDAVTEPVRR